MTDEGTQDRRAFIVFLVFFFTVLYVAGMFLCSDGKLSFSFSLFTTLLIAIHLAGALLARRKPFKEMEIFPREALLRIAGYGILLPLGVCVLAQNLSGIIPPGIRYGYCVFAYPLLACAVFQFQLKKNRGGKLHLSDRCLNTACFSIILLPVTGLFFRITEA